MIPTVEDKELQTPTNEDLVRISDSTPQDTPTLEGARIAGARAGEVFWPNALLPSTLPDSYILTWGYDADIDKFLSSAGHSGIDQHANVLLIDIANFQSRLENVSHRHLRCG